MLTVKDLRAADIIDPARYALHGYPYEAWRLLRREAPLHWFDMGERQGFWAVTRREDLVFFSKHPQRFRLAPRQAVFADSPPPEQRNNAGPLLRNLLNMDPPDHGHFRAAAADWFHPGTVEGLRPRIEAACDALLDELAVDGELRECDFVADFAVPFTLCVLAEMLGVPHADRGKLFEWTSLFVGAGDVEGEGIGQAVQRAREELFDYFAELAETRRRAPGTDVISTLVQARIPSAAGNEPIPRLELLSYFALLVVAGNETTRNAASGGLLALLQHEREWQRLRSDPSRLRTAVEEIVRWTSPVIQFCRTPVESFELHGQRIAAGESLCLFYPSANRDEQVFEQADEFRIDRKPNPHVGYGLGAHFCLGASVARLELQVIFERLVHRLEQVELAGPVERTRSSFLGGLKSMPIAWRLSPASSHRN